MLLVVFCIKDLVPADMEVAEERSPAMTDSSEGEVDQRIHRNDDLVHLDDLGDR